MKAATEREQESFHKMGAKKKLDDYRKQLDI